MQPSNLRFFHQITFEYIERINTIYKMIYRFEIGNNLHYIIFASIDDVMDNIDTITSSILSLNVGGFVETFPKERMGRYHRLGKENYISNYNYYIKFIASKKLRRDMIELFDDSGGELLFYYNFETKNQPIYIPF